LPKILTRPFKILTDYSACLQNNDRNRPKMTDPNFRASVSQPDKIHRVSQSVTFEYALIRLQNVATHVEIRCVGNAAVDCDKTDLVDSFSMH
jgi:hypothetical protein